LQPQARKVSMKWLAVCRLLMAAVSVISKHSLEHGTSAFCSASSTKLVKAASPSDWPDRLIEHCAMRSCCSTTQRSAWVTTQRSTRAARW